MYKASREPGEDWCRIACFEKFDLKAVRPLRSLNNEAICGF